MEGYDYVQNNMDADSPERVTKAPVINTETDNVGKS